MPDTRYVLAIDLGTSRLKVGVVDGRLRTVSTGRHSYGTISQVPGMAQQRPGDWLDALRRAVQDALEGARGVKISAISLSAQMPTLVALSSAGEPIGDAVTWQDARADTLVVQRLGARERQRVRTLAGTPIDGRYLIPMHLLRTGPPDYQPDTLLSAKDYLYFALTGLRVTDPSTASGFGNYSIDDENWSEELSALWSLDTRLLPEVVASTFTAPLNGAGVDLVAGVEEGTPVVVGGADSVCAHHYVSSAFPGAVSIIDGSSTVIIATLAAGAAVPDEVLVTPLVGASHFGVELDLLATGSTMGWLAELFETTTSALEEMTLRHPSPATADTLFFPYLAGGEQGALWRSDVKGSIQGLTRATSKADIILAAFEGIAFETSRCLELLGTIATTHSLVSVATPGGRHVGAALLAALGDYDVRTLNHESPSLMGAAMLAFEALHADLAGPTLDTGAPPLLDASYRSALPAKALRYLDLAPRPATGQSKR